MWILWSSLKFVKNLINSLKLCEILWNYLRFFIILCNSLTFFRRLTEMTQLARFPVYYETLFIEMTRIEKHELAFIFRKNFPAVGQVSVTIPMAGRFFLRSGLWVFSMSFVYHRSIVLMINHDSPAQFR